jgi:hypothetical protein
MNIPDDVEINFYFNLECFLRHLSRYQDISYEIHQNKKEFIKKCLYGILNIMAHYNHFYHMHGKKVKCYYYYTSLESKTFQMENQIAGYRSVYIANYYTNRKYRDFGNCFHNDVLPQLKHIIQRLPNINLIITEGIDSSIVPYVISESKPDAFNIILTQDIFDTLYMDNPKFGITYTAYKNKQPVVESTREGIIGSITRNIDFNYVKMSKFYTESIIKSHGSKIRTLYGIKKYDIVVEILEELLKSGVPVDNVNHQILIDALPTKLKSDYEIAHKGMDLDYQYALLSQLDKDDILVNQCLHTDDKDISFLNEFSEQYDVRLNWLQE